MTAGITGTSIETMTAGALRREITLARRAHGAAAKARSAAMRAEATHARLFNEYRYGGKAHRKATELRQARGYRRTAEAANEAMVHYASVIRALQARLAAVIEEGI